MLRYHRTSGRPRTKALSCITLHYSALLWVQVLDLDGAAAQQTVRIPVLYSQCLLA